MPNTYDLVIRGGLVLDGHGGTPFTADVAIRNGTIAHVGSVPEKGLEEIQASGAIVTPGFVDVHTHYDGQVTWGDRVLQSTAHGVTTVVIGNCGVGFAPCKPQDRMRLIKLMEGVEDIPGVVMTEGLLWNWESYPEFLDAIEARSHDANIASLFPHAPLRVFVMGERAVAGEPATKEDMAEMARLAKEAMNAGAIGFATSRSLHHRSSSGEKIATYGTEAEELLAIGLAVKSIGRRLLQIAADFENDIHIKENFPVIKRVAMETGLPVTMQFSQFDRAPDAWKEIMSQIREANRQGASIWGQTMPRANGFVLGLELTMHPFALCPTYLEMQDLPLEQRVARMRDSEVRRKLLSEKPTDPKVPLFAFSRSFARMFKLGEVPNYEPPASDSIAAEATRLGVAPEELAYDYLLEQGGKAKLLSMYANFADGNLDSVVEMISDKDMIVGAGDGGAHLGVICDSGFPTFILSYLSRDRSRGTRISLPLAVQLMSKNTAALVGLNDRGVVARGYRADINIIDYDNLKVLSPEISYDLPAGGRCLRQRAEGFIATIVNGQVTYRNGVATGNLPGKLVRGPQRSPAVA